MKVDCPVCKFSGEFLQVTFSTDVSTSSDVYCVEREVDIYAKEPNAYTKGMIFLKACPQCKVVIVDQ